MTSPVGKRKAVSLETWPRLSNEDSSCSTTLIVPVAAINHNMKTSIIKLSEFGRIDGALYALQYHFFMKYPFGKKGQAWVLQASCHITTSKLVAP